MINVILSMAAEPMSATLNQMGERDAGSGEFEATPTGDSGTVIALPQLAQSPERPA